MDYASLRRLVDHTIATGCGGMLGMAVAGEHTTLSFAEKTQMIRTIAETNAKRIPFIVSVTAPDVSETLALTRVARTAQANGVCVQLPPGLVRREALAFLTSVAAQGPNLLMVQDLDWTGNGLDVEDIVYLYENVAAFTWLKLETQKAGPKYSSVLEATNHGINVCGGWAVTQLMDAMARGVQAFVPTGLEAVYVSIFNLFASGDEARARKLFERVLPILNFSNQHMDISIRFFKELRHAEGIFQTSTCRTETAVFDPVQQLEAKIAVASAMRLMREFQGCHPEASE